MIRWLAVLLVMSSCATSQVAARGKEDTPRKRDEAAIRSQIKTWDRALVEGDGALMENILAADYLAAGAPREVYLAALEGGMTFTESSREHLQFRFYGDTAVVFGQWTQRGTTPFGGQFTSTFTFTDVWVKHGRLWKCSVTSADQVRQALAAFRPVRIGPDISADVVVLFRHGVTPEQIEEFRQTVLQAPPSSDRHALADSPVEEYIRIPSVQDFDAVALQLRTGLLPIERKFFVEEILRSSLVHRVFEDVVPSKISLD